MNAYKYNSIAIQWYIKCILIFNIVTLPVSMIGFVHSCLFILSTYTHKTPPYKRGAPLGGGGG